MRRLRIHKESCVNYDSYPLKIECKIVVENTENKNIEELEYSEKMNYDGLNMSIVCPFLNEPLLIENEKKGEISIKGTLHPLGPFEIRTLEYTLLLNKVARGGVFPLCSFINVITEGYKLSTYDYIKVFAEEIKQCISIQRTNSYSGSFRITTSADIHTSESNVIIRGYLPIKNSFTIEITKLLGFNGSDRHTGGVVKVGDRLTDTVIDFERTIKMQKCTNNIFLVEFKLIAIRDLNHAKSICFNLLPPELAAEEKCCFVNIPERHQEEIIFNSNIQSKEIK